jgi:hypothetical protein
MRLVITDDDGEERAVLPAVDLYDLGNRYWSNKVVDWIEETLQEEK